MPKPRPAATTTALLILTLLWGSTWAVIRVGLLGVPPFTGAAMRFALACALLLVMTPLFRGAYAPHPHARRVWIANGTLLFVVSYGVVYWAEQWVPSGLASVLFATLPLFVALFAHFLVPGERLTRGVIVGVLVGFVGVTVLYSEDLTDLGGAGTTLAAVVFLASPVCAALANVLVKRWGAGMHTVSKTTVPMLFGVVVLGAAAALVERDAAMTFNRTSIACIVYLAVFGSVVAFLLYFWLLEHVPVTRIVLIAYLTPVVAVIIGAVWLGEAMTPRVGLGSIGVIGGVVIAGRATGKLEEGGAK